MDRAKTRITGRKKRAFRIRKTVVGTAECPRLCVRRSLRHISAQIVDDISGKSLVQVTSSSKGFTGKKAGSKIETSKMVGESIAEKATEKGIERVVFDRKGYPFHGRVKALAEGVRSKGLKF